MKVLGLASETEIIMTPNSTDGTLALNEMFAFKWLGDPWFLEASVVFLVRVCLRHHKSGLFRSLALVCSKGLIL